MRELMGDSRVLRVKGHMCAQGMVNRDWDGEGLVMKSTGYLTSSPEIADEVSAKCSNKDGEPSIMSQFDFQEPTLVMPRGIQFGQVTRRVSYNAETGEVLQDLRKPQTACEKELFMNYETQLFSESPTLSVLLQGWWNTVAQACPLGGWTGSSSTSLSARSRRQYPSWSETADDQRRHD